MQRFLTSLSKMWETVAEDAESHIVSRSCRTLAAFPGSSGYLPHLCNQKPFLTPRERAHLKVLRTACCHQVRDIGGSELDSTDQCSLRTVSEYLQLEMHVEGNLKLLPQFRTLMSLALALLMPSPALESKASNAMAAENETAQTRSRDIERGTRNVSHAKVTECAQA